MPTSKQPNTGLNHHSTQVSTTTISTEAVALLIDGENVTAADNIPYILVEAGKMGGVNVRRVYGNWAEPSMSDWKRHLVPNSYDLEAIGNNLTLKTGKNGTDIALVVDAMDLLYEGYRYFCLVTGDSDYLALVQRLRREGCEVLGIGGPNTSPALKDICSRFLSLPQRETRVVTAASPTLREVPGSIVSSYKIAQLPAPATQVAPISANLLSQAYRLALQEGKDPEWVLFSTFGIKLRSLISDYDAIYGQAKLKDLLRQHPGLFETAQRLVGNATREADAVRLRQQPELPS